MKLGLKLLTAAGLCREQAILVAPFIKSSVSERLLHALAPEVAVTIYTRWRPEEVAAGVSDLEVFDQVCLRRNTELRLCDALHAKLYRFDDRVLIGSANLTNTALGWSARPNLELLRAVSRSTYINTFESRLRRDSIPATLLIQDAVRSAANALASAHVIHLEPGEDPFLDLPKFWLPRLRRPHLLLAGYTSSTDDFTAAAKEQYEDDRISIAAPAGLSDGALRSYVRSALLKHPLINALDCRLDAPQRFGEVRALVRRFIKSHRLERDPAEATQTLIRWLIHYFPDRYELHTAQYSEILSKRK